MVCKLQTKCSIHPEAARNHRNSAAQESQPCRLRVAWCVWVSCLLSLAKGLAWSFPICYRTNQKVQHDLPTDCWVFACPCSHASHAFAMPCRPSLDIPGWPLEVLGSRIGLRRTKLQYLEFRAWWRCVRARRLAAWLQTIENDGVYGAFEVCRCHPLSVKAGEIFFWTSWAVVMWIWVGETFVRMGLWREQGLEETEKRELLMQRRKKI